MSKFFEASCEDGVVTYQGVEVPAEILSAGLGSSTGLLFFQKDRAFYLPSSASDIDGLIERLVELTTQLETILSGLDAVSTTPGSQAANITQLGVLKDELDESRGTLK